MTDLTKKKDTELLKDLAAAQNKVQQFRFGMSGSRTRNVKEGRDLKKHIARILTELNARTK